MRSQGWLEAIYEALDGAYPPKLENSLSKTFERDAQWRAKSPLIGVWGDLFNPCGGVLY